jgi:8-oxo-dGTP diphosphatase
MNQEDLNNQLKWLFDNAMPGISVDCVAFAYQEERLKVLCLRYRNTDIWSLPGGWVFKHESLHQSAFRTLQERTGLDSIYLKQFQTFGEVNRANIKEVMSRLMPPFAMEYFPSRTVSVGYYALVDYRKVNLSQDFLSDLTAWHDVEDLPALIFDHPQIIKAGVKSLKSQFDHLPLGHHLLPEEFTIAELQKLHEEVLGEKLERSNFQKKILSSDILERLDKMKTGKAYKSPYLYRFNKEKYKTWINQVF